MSSVSIKKNNRPDKPAITLKSVFFWGFLVAVIALVISLFVAYNPPGLLFTQLNSDTNSLVFAALMAVLPLAGFPISIFLVLVGMMYGITGGIVLTGGIMLFHMIATYYLVHSLVRPLLVRLLQRFHMKIPKLPKRGKKRLGFVFMILPGVPYAAKNYLFALTEIPLAPYLLIGWAAQFGLSIPLIVLGKGVIRMDPLILLLGACLILIGLALQYYLRRLYKNLGGPA
ncbi:MAG: hypothetical protein SCH71_13380 [Desulfobulbaceae bacterium]|nr:hypothetical protein [Desulfobulbaceae bacterium]